MATICMLSNLYPPIMSGSSLQILHLSRELARRGHTIVIITARAHKDAPEYEEAGGVHVYRLPAVRLPELSISLNFPWLTYTYWPANVRRMKEIVSRHQVEILHLHNHMFDLAFAAVQLQRSLRLPLIVSVHTPITHNNALFNFCLTRAERYILKPLIIDRAQALVIPDFNVVPYLEKRFRARAAAIIPYGIHPPREPRPELIEALRARYGLANRRMVLSVGHLHAIRNRLDLLRAFRIVKASVPDAVLVIVGSTTYPPALTLAKELELGDSVIFTGTLVHDEVIALLSLSELEAHWFTLEHPPIDSSPGPATMEAMLAGKAAMTYASENTFGPGVLQNGRNVLLVRPGDPPSIAATIIDLLSDPSKVRAIGTAARATADQHFSWPAIVTQFERLYGQVGGVRGWK